MLGFIVDVMRRLLGLLWHKCNISRYYEGRRITREQEVRIQGTLPETKDFANRKASGVIRNKNNLGALNNYK